ncbi:protein of unknown function [Taphrina deformans PYCC 5710]|uniref:Uncharacterized protein n=1 Tax=Taphrina deformans (strain PYCC 5710 / ATCC 11124 / CBS 356.35 / IMI 108563 / JCM 9778 / NBRC 8474) TaxID=1097556 RepID=R4XJK2_TAPDE|nr:protein of unknown function [Taphrina deformans PYCC 5710]|eukprot:CCG84633.1 protein of unknown function [Taphrina deformans PYCC 5710]
MACICFALPLDELSYSGMSGVLAIRVAYSSQTTASHDELTEIEPAAHLASLGPAITQMQRQMNAFLTAEMTKATGTSIVEEEPDILKDED